MFKVLVHGCQETRCKPLIRVIQTSNRSLIFTQELAFFQNEGGFPFRKLLGVILIALLLLLLLLLLLNPNKPDIVVVDKKEKCLIIDIACPFDTRTSEREKEKFKI